MKCLPHRSDIATVSGKQLCLCSLRDSSRPSRGAHVRKWSFDRRAGGAHLDGELRWVVVRLSLREAPEVGLKVDHVVRLADLLEEEAVVVHIEGEQVNPLEGPDRARSVALACHIPKVVQ